MAFTRALLELCIENTTKSVRASSMLRNTGIQKKKVGKKMKIIQGVSLLYET